MYTWLMSIKILFLFSLPIFSVRSIVTVTISFHKHSSDNYPHICSPHNSMRKTIKVSSRVNIEFQLVNSFAEISIHFEHGILSEYND